MRSILPKKPSKIDESAMAVHVRDRAFVKEVARLTFVFLAVYAALAVFVIWAPILPDGTRASVSQLILLAGPVASVVLYALGTRKWDAPSGRTQRWWAAKALIAAALVGTVLPVAVRLLLPNSNLVMRDAATLAGYSLICLGVLLAPKPATSSHSRFRVVLDTLILTGGVGTAGWYLTLAKAAPASVSLVAFWSGAARLAMDFCLATSILALVHHGFGRGNRLSIKLLMSALAASIVGDMLPHVTGFGAVSNYFEVVQAVSRVLLVLAAFSIRYGPVSSQATENRVPSLMQQALPYLTLPGVFLVVTDAVIHHSPARVVLGALVGAGVTIGLLVMRQLAALHENRNLLLDLEDAYERLEEQSTRIEGQNDSLQSLNGELEAAFKRIAESNRILGSLATTDGLTGLPNQRSFQTRLREETSRAARAGTKFCIAMIDVDLFKQYNDSFGHPAGDDVLRLVAAALKTSVRDCDFLARYGGEEFVCILPDTYEVNGAEICERIRRTVGNLNPEHRQVTVSVGIAEWSETDANPHELLERADFALYAAKKRGRNRVVRHTTMPQELAEVPRELVANADSSQAILGATLLAIETATGFNRSPKSGERDRRSLEGMLASLELRDVETEGHTERVMWMSLRLYVELCRVAAFDMDAQILRELALGALLHDIGKIGVSDEILNKPGRLDDNEFAQMRRHTVLGARFIERFPHLADALPVVRSHHEKWDGTGYPDRLEGEEIPVTARVFSACDTFDAMVSNRSYQTARPWCQARKDIFALRGTQLDPVVVDAFMLITEDEWRRIQSGDSQWIVQLVYDNLNNDERISA